MKSKLYLLGIAFLVVVPLFFLIKFAGQPSYMEQCGNMSPKNRGSGIEIRDWTIKTGDFDCLVKYYSKASKITVGDVSGGSVIEAHSISDYIFDNNIGFKVVNECASACTFLLMASKDAEICERARIRVHMIGSAGYSMSFNTKIGLIHLMVMKRFGANTENYSKLVGSVPHSTMRDLTWLEMSELGFTYRKVERC